MEVINRCNCTDAALLSFLSIKPSCPDGFKCPNEYYNKTEFTTYVQDVCLKECPLECYHSLYKTTTSSFNLIGENYIKSIKERPNLVSDFINRPIDAQTAKESVAKVNIFYDSLSYIELTESPQMTLVSLFASVGGNLGLFLGVSFLTVCELIEFLFEVYYQRKKTSKVESIEFPVFFSQILKVNFFNTRPRY